MPVIIKIKGAIIEGIHVQYIRIIIIVNWLYLITDETNSDSRGAEITGVIIDIVLAIRKLKRSKTAYGLKTPRRIKVNRNNSGITQIHNINIETDRMIIRPFSADSNRNDSISSNRTWLKSELRSSVGIYWTDDRVGNKSLIIAGCAANDSRAIIGSISNAT